MSIEQEFTHIASPQENGFIESLHSQLLREVVDRTLDQIEDEENISIPYKTNQQKHSETEGNPSTKRIYSDSQFVQFIGSKSNSIFSN